jgi:ureidoglycolate lyase
MNPIAIVEADATACRPFGRLVDLAGDGPDVVAEPLEGVRDRFTREPVVTGAVHAGMTVGPTLPQAVSRMERHPTTNEVLLCLDDPIVVLVSADPAGRPAAGTVRALRLRAGQCLSLDPGVWHSVGFGLGGPSSYYWLATVSSTETPWAEILGGPLLVAAPEEDA